MPPSPTHHPLPSLQSLSNSISNSSSSPPEPTTPPRTSRSRTRYPDLGRVPLHRRGNSKTYECLEDLLKEAGYKETRIFTPETERSRSGDDQGGDGENHENRLSVRDGMEAVVGFFAGLLPSAMSSRASLVPPPESGMNDPATSQDSPSPLANRALQRQVVQGGYDLADPEPHTPSTLTSSIESLGEPTLRLNRRINNSAGTVNLHAPLTYHSQRPSLPHRNTTPLFHNSQQMQKQSSRSSLHLQAIQHHSNMVSPRSTRASAYVRHMASASSMPPRPNSTPAHITRPVIFVTDNDHDTQPPLPPSWLESVARAVLFGGTGAHIGGPSSFISHESLTSPSSPSSAKPHVLRSARSSLSQVSSRRSKYYRQPMNRRSGLSDQTNSPVPSTAGSRDSFHVPPLFSQIERGRSRRSEGEVSRTRVVCRSAPGSRNGSVTRSGGNDDGKERWRKRDNTRKKEENGRLPSLARTQAEGDVWDQNEGRTRGNNGGSNNRYLSGWGADAHSEAGSSTSSEEEEDGELDLARILVPPKRQNSIKSLRKHLASEAPGPGHSAHTSLIKNYAAGAGSTSRREIGRGDGGSGGHRVPRILHRRKTTDDDDWDGESQEEWGGGWVRKGAAAGNRESEDDSFVGFGFIGEGRTNLVGTTSKKNGTNRLGFRGLMGGNGSGS